MDDDDETTSKGLGRPQTQDELKFYARNYFCLTIIGMVFFLPFGLMALYFSRQTDESNKNSEWEDAYRCSSRTVWCNMLAIIAGVGIIYALILVVG